ncbi:MAG: hypothetical protein U0871_15530 [Gemmataceae bacterium]
MALRALFSLWFVLASVFAPAFCCCAPFAGVGTAQAAPVHHAAAKPADDQPACPHCKHSVQPAPQPPADNAPCPSHPGKEHCPCKERQLAQATPAAPELRTAALFGDGFPDLVLFSPAPSAHTVLAEGGHRPADHHGPPPLAGVDLLRRLHILIC